MRPGRRQQHPARGCSSSSSSRRSRSVRERLDASGSHGGGGGKREADGGRGRGARVVDGGELLQRGVELAGAAQSLLERRRRRRRRRVRLGPARQRAASGRAQIAAGQDGARRRRRRELGGVERRRQRRRLLDEDACRDGSGRLQTEVVRYNTWTADVGRHRTEAPCTTGAQATLKTVVCFVRYTSSEQTKLQDTFYTTLHVKNLLSFQSTVVKVSYELAFVENCFVVSATVITTNKATEERWPRLILRKKQEAQLSPRDRAMRRVS